MNIDDVVIYGDVIIESNKRQIVDNIEEELSILPILEQHFEFDSKSNTLFFVITIPEDIRISGTRYLNDDSNVYFSVKGNNELLYSGSLPITELVNATLEAHSDVIKKSSALGDAN